MTCHGLVLAGVVLGCTRGPEAPCPQGEHVVGEGPHQEDCAVAETAQHGQSIGVDEEAYSNHAETPRAGLGLGCLGAWSHLSTEVNLAGSFILDVVDDGLRLHEHPYRKATGEQHEYPCAAHDVGHVEVLGQQHPEGDGANAVDGDYSAAQIHRIRIDVLAHSFQGKTNGEIASSLGIARNTVKNHLARLYDKTGINNRTELTRWAIENEAL